jgi:hypothetical protein
MAALYAHRAGQAVWMTGITVLESLNVIVARLAEEKRLANREESSRLHKRLSHFYIACGHELNEAWPGGGGVDILGEYMRMPPDGSADQSPNETP